MSQLKRQKEALLGYSQFQCLIELQIALGHLSLPEYLESTLRLQQTILGRWHLKQISRAGIYYAREVPAS